MRNKAFIVLLAAEFLGISPLSGLAVKFAPGSGVGWVVGEEIEESKIGYNFSGAVEVEVWRGFDYGFRYYYSDVSANLHPVSFEFDSFPPTLHPQFIHHVFALTNSWSPGWRWVDPYVRGAVGLYSWQQLER